MKGRFKRTIGSLLLVLGGYFTYAVLAVPMLEPSIELASSSPSAATHANATPKSRGFESLFAPGSWELDRPKVLETDRGTLIFDDYRALPNSRMQLNRCTLIFRSGQDDEASRPIVLRATEGAILFFEGELNVPRGEFGRLIGGELSGVVTIHSPPTPGADDGLEITTRDVRIEERRIWTPSNVAFKYGPNSGSGSDLSIAMHPPAKAPQTSGAGSRLGRLKSFELVRVDKIKLQIPADSLSDSPLGSPAAPQQESDASAVLEIRCRGPLEFDFEELQLTINDHVDVIRHNAEGPSDQLNCQELRIHFQAPDAKSEASNEKGTSLKLAPTKLVAIGFPVTLRIDSYQAYARGEQLEYDFAKQRISMRDRENVVLGNDSYEVKSKWLWYELRKGKQLGNMRAGGPGHVTGQLGKDRQPFEATWQGEVVLQPFQDGNVLSMMDAAHIVVKQAGEVRADELHVYLAEQPRPEDPARATIVAEGMRAVGNVRFDSARLSGMIQDVQVWFAQPPSDTVPLAGPVTGGAPDSPSPANPAPARPGEQVQKLVVHAERLNAEVQLGDKPQLLQLGAKGKVHCEEQAAPGAISGMSLDCDVFHVLDGASENPIATIEGSPARVMAQGAELVGKVIEIHQGSNRAFIQGAGQMSLPRPQTPQAPWFVRWEHRMRFDGQQATFDGDVVARGVQSMQAGGQVRFNASGDSLQVTLTRFIRFTQPDDTDDIALRELLFKGQCFLQSETIDPRGTRKTAEQMEIRDLRIDQVSGVLHGDGPGWLTSVHQGQDIFKEGQFATTPKGLHFLRVDFQQELVGSLTGRKMEFLGNVKTVYGPVAEWDQVIDVTDPSRFGPRDVVVTSQRLALTDMGQTRDRFDAVELEATGNAFVRGQTFNASGQRISYAKSKDQLVLEGDGRNHAMLSYQRTPNATPSPLKARKILFWPETKQFEISDLHSIDLQNLSQFNR